MTNSLLNENENEEGHMIMRNISLEVLPNNQTRDHHLDQ